MKINTDAFIRLCIGTNAFYNETNNETFIILILQHYRDERTLCFYEPYHPRDNVFTSRYKRNYRLCDLAFIVRKAIQHLQYSSNSDDLLLQECLMSL